MRHRHDVSFGNQAAFVALTVLCWYELEPVDCLALVRGRMALLIAAIPKDWRTTDSSPANWHVYRAEAKIISPMV